MKAVVCVLISTLLFLSACSSAMPALPLVGNLPRHSREAYATPEPTPTPEPEYEMVKVKALEDGEFAYVRKERNDGADAIGAAALGVKLAVMERTDEWCRVIFGNDAGYIKTSSIEVLPEKEVLPRHEINYAVPRIETEPVEKKFDNRLKVRNVRHSGMGTERQSIDVYTSGGKLLASDATFEITDGVITAPAISEVPVRIEIKDGALTSCKGITLSRDETFDTDSDMGSVISKDKTVIQYGGRFLEDADIYVTSGVIYGSDGETEIKPGCYFKPGTIKDNLVDVALYTDDIEIDMLFAKDGNLLGDMIYKDEICLLQKGTLEKLEKAADKFREDGYRIVLYDAYRPYSVTVKLYKKYRNKYVAPIKPGSNHNRGAAVDMSLLDDSGVPIEMPSPIHTLNSSSNRSCKSMSKKARANMEYMAKVMRSCGFRTIETEWWHFVDTDNKEYLRTDYDLNSLLLVIHE